MKKIFFSLAILAFSSMSMLAATDNNTAPVDCKSKSECAKVKKAGSKKSNKAFDGIELTAEQQTKLADLRKECRRNDSKNNAVKKENLTDEQKKQMKAEVRAKKLEARKNYLDGVKQILTPEQYTKFLENNFMSANKGGDKGKMHKFGQQKGNGKFSAKQGKGMSKKAKKSSMASFKKDIKVEETQMN